MRSAGSRTKAATGELRETQRYVFKSGTPETKDPPSDKKAPDGLGRLAALKCEPPKSRSLQFLIDSGKGHITVLTLRPKFQNHTDELRQLASNGHLVRYILRRS